MFLKPAKSFLVEVHLTGDYSLNETIHLNLSLLSLLLPNPLHNLQFLLGEPKSKVYLNLPVKSEIQDVHQTFNSVSIISGTLYQFDGYYFRSYQTCFDGILFYIEQYRINDQNQHFD